MFQKRIGFDIGNLELRGSGASCDACVKADACCVASGGTTEMCKYAETCTAQPDSERAMTVATCTSVVQAFASNPNAPAACK